jgi:hypothetical protein
MKTIAMMICIAACAAPLDTATDEHGLQCYPCDPDDPVELVDEAHLSAGANAALYWLGAPTSFDCNAWPSSGPPSIATCTVYVPVGEPGCPWGVSTCTTSYGARPACAATCN